MSWYVPRGYGNQFSSWKKPVYYQSRTSSGGISRTIYYVRAFVPSRPYWAKAYRAAVRSYFGH